MKRRDIIILSLGLIVGLLVGMISVGSSADFRESLFGTAGDDNSSLPDKGKKLEYYLLELPAAQTWIAEKYPETGQELGDAVDTIAKLPASADFKQDFKNAEVQIKTLLPQMYAGLTNAENINEPKVNPDDLTSACLALDDDPYSMTGPVLYLYISLPAGKAKEAGVPKEWERLEKPKDSDLYWQLLACYPELSSDNPS
jgi:hypothetical protein